MLTESSFDTGEVVINYAEGPALGSPLVLLHGSTLDWQSWQHLIPPLAQTWHAYACDLRGHGKSGGLRQAIVSLISCLIRRLLWSVTSANRLF